LSSTKFQAVPRSSPSLCSCEKPLFFVGNFRVISTNQFPTVQHDENIFTIGADLNPFDDFIRS
jgi:hypothetical protein